MRDQPAWFYQRDPWYWATWEGARLAGLLAARDVPFDERIRRVEELAGRADDLRLAPKSSEQGKLTKHCIDRRR